MKFGVDLQFVDIGMRALQLKSGCIFGQLYPACLDMIARGTINVEALISAVAPLAEGAAWFKRLYDKEPGLMKVVLVP